MKDGGLTIETLLEAKKLLDESMNGITPEQMNEMADAAYNALKETGNLHLLEDPPDRQTPNA